MLVNLIAWIYISFICLAWGNLFLSIVGAGTGLQKMKIDVSLVCLAGLAMTGTLALLLSLFLPLNWKAHLIIISPAFYFCLKTKNRHLIRAQAGRLMGHFSGMGGALLSGCILMTLIISSHTLIHPDTLYYHASSILLFEKYGAVPGIANLRVELGLQSLWFAALAVFKLDTPTLFNTIFLNGAVLCWYFIFITSQIEKEWRKWKQAGPGTRTNGWAWLLLLAYTLVSWTQVRLTAASASPDFIVALYTWAAVFAFLQIKRNNDQPDIYRPLVFLFCFTAVLIKVSAILLPILAIAAIAPSLRRKPVKSVVLYSLAALAMLIPLLIRNRIASGYPLYPSSFPDVFHADWKLTLAAIHRFADYISVYARFRTDSRPVEALVQQPFSQWMPVWWHFTTLSDQLLIAVAFFGIVVTFVGMIVALLRRIRNKPPLLTPAENTRSGTRQKTPAFAFIVVLAGSLLWFLKAPDPRFGIGYLIPLIYLAYRRTGQKKSDSIPGLRMSGIIGIFRKARTFRIAGFGLLIAMAGYSGQRFRVFFHPAELIYPAGIDRSAYEPIGCEALKIDLLENKIEVRGDNIAVPAIGSQACKDDYYDGFLLRGRTIAEGFKPLPPLIASDTSYRIRY